MKEWDTIIPDGIKFLSAENRVLTRKVRELESENDALQARAEKAEAMVERLMRMVEDRFVLLGNSLDGHLQDCNCAVSQSSTRSFRRCSSASNSRNLSDVFIPAPPSRTQ